MPLLTYAKYDITNPNCTSSLKLSLREEYSNINVVVDKQNILDKVLYTVEINGVSENINIKDSETAIIYSPIDGYIKLENINPGVTKQLLFFASNLNPCYKYEIITINVLIPFYNKYKDNALCVGNEEYFLCRENSSVNVTLEEFTRLINEYIKSKEVIEEEEKPIIETKINIIDQFMNFLLEYYIYILLLIIVSGTTGIVILEVKKRRDIL